MRTTRLSTFVSAGLLFFLISGLTCISRDNKWDPINFVQYGSLCPDDSLWALQKDIAPHRTYIKQFNRDIPGYNDSLRADSLRIQPLAYQNDVIRAANLDTVNYNNYIEAYNVQQTIPDSLRYKHLLQFLNPVPLLYSLTTLATKKDSAVTATVGIKVRFLVYESSCPANKDSIKPYKDSVFAEIDSALRFCRSYEASISKFQTAASAINDSNAVIGRKNDTINRYNEGIWWEKMKQSGKYKVVDSAGLLLHSLQQPDYLKPGDTVLFVGTVPVASQLKIESSGTQAKPIVLMGTKSMTSVITTKDGVVFTARQYINLINLTICNSTQCGLKLEEGSSNIVVENCVIRNNALHGIEVTSSSINVNNCRILHNGRDGIYLNPQGQVSYFQNVLIVKNRGAGFYAVKFDATLSSATISHNDSGGIKIANNLTDGGNKMIHFSSVTYNRGFGLKVIELKLSNTQLDVKGCNFYQNTPNDISTTNDLGYFNLNPFYADTANDNFSIGSKELQGKGMVIGYQESP